MGKRPDCTYFLLLGLCGAAFLLTIGGILTYVAFNPGSIDGRPHSALSHIPHFHHHHTHYHHPPPPQHPPNHHINNNFTHAPHANGNWTESSRNISVAHPAHPHFNFHPGKVMNSTDYEAKAKESLVLAIIGPLCILMGIVIGLIVGVLALKYDCDKEPQPNISFLRLRSELSLNCEATNSNSSSGGLEKGGGNNNYELIRPSSTIEQAGGHFSINPVDLS